MIKIATRTIADGGGNWSAAGTWVEGVAPTTADAVVATATSGNVTIDTTTCVASTMVLTNYVGTMTFTAGQKLTVTTTVTFVAGMSLSGTGTLQLSDTATITSGGLTFPGSIIFDGGTWTLGDDWTVAGSITTQTAIVTLNGNTLNIGGSMTINFYTAGTTTLVLNGTGTWSCSNTYYVANNLTFNTMGTITLSSNIYYSGTSLTLTYIAGTMIVAGSTLNLTGTSCIFNTSGMTWNNITNVNETAITLSSALNCAGTLTLAAATTFSGNFLITCTGLTISKAGTQVLSGDIDCNGNMLVNTGAAVINGAGKYIYVSGDLTLTGFNITSGTIDGIVLDGTGTWSHSTIALFIGCPLQINTAGTITIGTQVGFRTKTLTYTAGTVDASTNSSTLYIGAAGTFTTNGLNWYNIMINAGAAMTLTLGSNLTCTNNLTVDTTNDVITTAGAFNISCANFIMDAGSTFNMKSSQTLTVTNSMKIQGDNLAAATTCTMKAVTASTAFLLNYSGSAANCNVSGGVIFTDVNASGGNEIINYNGGTLTRTTNITNYTGANIGAVAGGGASFFTMGN